LAGSLTIVIWSGSLSDIYKADNILELNYKVCKRNDGPKVDVTCYVFYHTKTGMTIARKSS
jgi:hypothetical protein